LRMRTPFGSRAPAPLTDGMDSEYGFVQSFYAKHSLSTPLFCPTLASSRPLSPAKYRPKTCSPSPSFFGFFSVLLLSLSPSSKQSGSLKGKRPANTRREAADRSYSRKQTTHLFFQRLFFDAAVPPIRATVHRPRAASFFHLLFVVSLRYISPALQTHCWSPPPYSPFVTKPRTRLKTMHTRFTKHKKNKRTRHTHSFSTQTNARCCLLFPTPPV